MNFLKAFLKMGDYKERINDKRSLYSLLHGFTKMAVSPSIMVRLSKFKIWHSPDFNADLSDVPVTSRVTWPA